MHRVTLNASALTSLGQRPRSLAERGYEGSRGLQSTEESDVVARCGATAEPPSNIQRPTSNIQLPGNPTQTSASVHPFNDLLFHRPKWPDFGGAVVVPPQKTPRTPAS